MCCAFLPKLELFRERNIEVVKGYFQTFDYFLSPDLDAEIRESFHFLPGIQQRAEKILHDKVDHLVRSAPDNYTFVGIHVRHGKFLLTALKNLIFQFLRHGRYFTHKEFISWTRISAARVFSACY
jgi:hypothetical protein